jgi:antitoxin ParD1/3/4
MPSSYTIGSHFESLIRQLVKSGRYGTASEVVRDGLRLVEERERRLSALDAAIERGIADADAGRVHTIEEAEKILRERLTRRHA